MVNVVKSLTVIDKTEVDLSYDIPWLFPSSTICLIDSSSISSQSYLFNCHFFLQICPHSLHYYLRQYFTAPIVMDFIIKFKMTLVQLSPFVSDTAIQAKSQENVVRFITSVNKSKRVAQNSLEYLAAKSPKFLLHISPKNSN